MPNHDDHDKSSLPESRGYVIPTGFGARSVRTPYRNRWGREEGQGRLKYLMAVGNRRTRLSAAARREGREMKGVLPRTFS